MFLFFIASILPDCTTFPDPGRPCSYLATLEHAAAFFFQGKLYVFGGQYDQKVNNDIGNCCIDSCCLLQPPRGLFDAPIRPHYYLAERFLPNHSLCATQDPATIAKYLFIPYTPRISLIPEKWTLLGQVQDWPDCDKYLYMELKGRVWAVNPGHNSAQANSDVLISSDGRSWIALLKHAPWPDGLQSPKLFVFQNAL